MPYVFWFYMWINILKETDMNTTELKKHLFKVQKVSFCESYQSLIVQAYIFLIVIGSKNSLSSQLNKNLGWTFQAN